MEGALGEPFGKMGYGVLRYSPNPVVAVIDSRYAGSTVQTVIDTPRNVPVVATIAEAKRLGARVLLLGIAPPGGLLPPLWKSQIDSAVKVGMSIVNGLHEPLAPMYANLAPGQFVWDVRQEPDSLVPGTGLASNVASHRILAVGTDMAVGKMTAAFELYRNLGSEARFVATGQIGIVISGSGVPLDAVRVDYASGAIEREVLKAAESKPFAIVIEGQGSLLHPSSSATLPLMRGAVPTHLLLCARAGQTSLTRMPKIKIPPLAELAGLYEEVASACGTSPRPMTLGIALNTSDMSSDIARAYCTRVAEETGLPCADPVRHGAGVFVERLRKSA